VGRVAQGTGHRAQGTHSRPMQATVDGWHLTFRHPFDFHARLRLRSSTDYTSPSHTPTPAPGPPHRPHPLLHSHHHSHSRSHSHSAFCVRRSLRAPPLPLFRHTPVQLARVHRLFFSLSRRDGPSLASAPATLPRDPHHSSLLTSRSSHLALPLHSTRLDSTYLDSPRLAPPPVFMSCAARRLTAAAALPSRLGRYHAPL
jgi:hypothetical protein